LREIFYKVNPDVLYKSDSNENNETFAENEEIVHWKKSLSANTYEDMKTFIEFSASVYAIKPESPRLVLVLKRSNNLETVVTVM
jgi:hypothetical protein